MKAWQVKNNFGVQNLILAENIKELDLPLNPNEVRIDIKACSINYRDLMLINGEYNKRQPLPFIPLSDCAGIVTETGKNVTKWKVSDEVIPILSQTWMSGELTKNDRVNSLGSMIPGCLRRSAIFNEQGLVKKPLSLTFSEAATLPCAALTAFNALTSFVQFNPDDVIVIQGSGGVALFALSFAKALRLKTICLTSSNTKANKLKSLGADHVINYNEHKDWSSIVLGLTNNEGVSGVIELGGQNTINQSLKSMKIGGSIFLIGVLGGGEAKINMTYILMNMIKIFGVYVGHKASFLSMNRVIEQNKIKPVIDKVFSFDNSKEAFLYFENENHFGKVVIEV